MTRAALNRFSMILPIILSAAAFFIVLANILAGVPPQPDENASAHLFQILIVLQIPIIAVFILSANWRGSRPLLFLGLQFGAIALAFLPVWSAGY
jgi:hypothetical protein